MLFKNAELFNVVELIPAENGGYHMSRVPSDVRAAMSQTGQNAAIAPAGVEIRFVINSGSAKITLASSSKRKLTVYYGAFQHSANPGIDYYGPDAATIEISPAASPEAVTRLSKICSSPFSPNVIRLLLDPLGHDVIFDIEGDIRPPRADEVPETKFLMYGSSITQGCFAVISNNSYVYRISRALKCDAYNFGFGGSCLLEPEICDYIAKQASSGRAWDFALFELGINTVNQMEHDEFEKRATYLFDSLKANAPGKKIFVTDIYFHLAELTNNGRTAERRERLKKVIADRSNVFYIPANTLFTEPYTLIDDGVHMDVDAVSRIADNWHTAIKDLI